MQRDAAGDRRATRGHVSDPIRCSSAVPRCPLRFRLLRRLLLLLLSPHSFCSSIAAAARSLTDRIVAVCSAGVSPDGLDGQRGKTKESCTRTNSERQTAPSQPHSAPTPTQPLHLTSPSPSSSSLQPDGGAPTEIRTQAGTRPRSPHGHAAVRNDQHTGGGGKGTRMGAQRKRNRRGTRSAAGCVRLHGAARCRCVCPRCAVRPLRPLRLTVSFLRSSSSAPAVFTCLATW